MVKEEGSERVTTHDNDEDMEKKAFPFRSTWVQGAGACNCM
jgi:hypothetical protein